MIILDTNVLSALMHTIPDPSVAAWLDRQPRTSIWTTSITIFELKSGLEIMTTGKRRSGLVQSLDLLMARLDHRIAPFDEVAAVHAADLIAARQRRGRPRELRDTMIAGIVMARHAALATRNVAHFDDISAAVLNPWA